jgi:diguanylate cyclase (GGDEF)-like protein
MTILEKPRMKVLVADDDPISRRLLQVSLAGSEYEIAIVANGAEALRVLEGADCPRLAILDWMMPEIDGVEVCRALRRRVGEPYVYVILLTAKGHPAEIIEGLEAGADDYITKPFDIHELKARLRAGRRILDLQEQLVSANDRLRIQATHDPLTGFLNRGTILDSLEREMARSAREDRSLAVIMADIDHFKTVNDTYGHLAGDAILQTVAKRIQDSIRTYDQVGRYGGEEFLIVSPGCTLEQACDLAERLRACVCKEPEIVRDESISVTMSFGLAIADENCTESAELLRAADSALYLAKNRGRNRVEVGQVPVLR